MPDRDYNLNYNVGGNSVAQFDAIAARLTTINALLDLIGPKMRGLGKLPTANINAFAKSLTGLSQALTATNTGATNVASSVRRAGSSAAFAATNVKNAGTAAQKLGSSLGTAAKNAQNAATGMNAAGKAAGSLTPQLTAAAAAANSLRGATVKVGTSTQGASTALGGFTQRMVALQAARAAFGIVLDESKKIEEHWKAAAEEATNFRDTLRELASLKGQPGANNNVSADTLDLALQSGLKNKEEARTLEQKYQNLGPTVRAKGHYKPTQGTPEQLEADILAETGKTARRLGIDSGAAGEGIGTAGLYHEFTTKEDAMEQFGGAMKGLSEGKVDYSLGVRALSKGMSKLLDPNEAKEEGALPGKVNSFAEGGVYMGAMSLGTGSADEAQMRMVQISRLLNPDAKNEEGRAALKEAGVSPDMSDPDKLIKLSEHLKAQKVVDVQGWLSEHNLGSVSIREKTEGAFKVTDVLKKSLAETRKGAKTNEAGKKAMVDNETFMKTDRSAQAAMISAVKDVTDTTEGIEGMEVLNMGKQAAEERRRQQDKTAPYNQFTNLMETEHALNPFSWVSHMAYGTDMRGVAQENNEDYGAIPRLKKEAERVKADITHLYPDLSSSNLKTRADAFTKGYEIVQSKGGDPLGARELSEEARKRVKATRPAMVPAQKPAAAIPAAVGPQASNAGPASGTDPRLLSVNTEQSKSLREIVGLLRSGGTSTASPSGPLPADGGDFSPRRA